MAATNSKLWYLENFNLFKGMEKDELMEIEEKTRMKTIKKNEYIYFPEDPSTSVYFLKSGRVKLSTYSPEGKEIIKAILWPGEIFGEIGLVKDDNRTDFAQAINSDVLICSMGMEDMKKAMQMNPKLSVKIMKLIGLRFRKIERKLESLVFKDARARLIDLLKELAEERGKNIGSEILVKHYLTHQEIANLTAISRQKVTTLLNDLKEENQIHLERKSFIIRNIDALK